MFHFCIMGGHEGELTADQQVWVTLFGACELKRPTLAKQIIGMRRRPQGVMPKRMHFFITICGGTELRAPTLAEEFLAMQEAVRAGLIALDDWDSAVARLGTDGAFQVGSFTLMGGFSSDEVPAENEEIEGLAINRHLGHISEHAGKTLELGVGRTGSERTAVLRQAFAAAAPA